MPGPRAPPGMAAERGNAEGAGMRKRAVIRSTAGLLGVAMAVLAIAGTGETTAGFTDATYVQAAVRTEAAPPAPPVVADQSAGSALFIDHLGRLFVSGMRNSGDGAGSAATPATAAPTLVQFPEGTKIVDAAGSSNDFSSQSSTSYMALDSEGRVWTWGAVYSATLLFQPPGYQAIGRGTITQAQSYTPGQVTRTADGGTLPKIIEIARIENQFLALDESGTMWSWGYDGENLPRDSEVDIADADSRAYPARSNTTTTASGDTCTGTTTSTVSWHSIWGGNNAGAAVARNGLIYSWGYDTPSNNANTTRATQTCPRLNESANRALFAAYQNLYRAGSVTYNPNASETDRNTQYAAIVAAMVGGVLAECNSTQSTVPVDAGPCPVRQLGMSARAPRLLLQNGVLYTWKISNEGTYGDPFLGRSATANPYVPTIVLRNVDYVVPGISALTALTRDGKVYGWGRNDFCQAIGARVSGTASCGVESESIVYPPTQVAGIPADVTITDLRATQCATWAQAADGRTWAWGGGTITGDDYNNCVVGSAASQGYKIYDRTRASQSSPFGPPVTAASTGTIRVR